MPCGWVRGFVVAKLTDTLLGKLLIRLFLPSMALSLHCSWLNSQIWFPQSSKRINSTILSRSFREARRAGENTTISTPKLSATAAAKMAIEKVYSQ